jgi:hypothetical protein
MKDKDDGQDFAIGQTMIIHPKPLTNQIQSSSKSEFQYCRIITVLFLSLLLLPSLDLSCYFINQEQITISAIRQICLRRLYHLTLSQVVSYVYLSENCCGMGYFVY